LIGVFEPFGKAGAQAGLDWSQGLLIGFGALLIVGLIGEWRKAKEERWQGWGDAFELMVIIGVAGELFFDGWIFGFSGRLSRIQDAALEAVTADLKSVTKTAGDADELARKATETASNLSAINEAFEKKYGPLLPGLQPRPVDEGDLRDGMKGVPRGIITIVELDEAEPRDLAIRLTGALRKLNFTVRIEELKGTSPLTGIVVCQQGTEEIRLVKGLNAARLGAKLMAVKAPDRPDFCDKPVPGSVPFGTIVDPVRGTVIFVGQKPAPPPP
jgi:hypothetical protein